MIYEVLEKLGISYERVCHEAVFTTEQAQFIKTLISGTGCKNLLTKNRKGDFYLIILEDGKKADIKKLAEKFGTSRLSFASEEELGGVLGLKAGSVSPFGIINDAENKVKLLLDSDLKGGTLLFHPNVNTETISVSFDDLVKFIEYENHKYFLF